MRIQLYIPVQRGTAASLTRAASQLGCNHDQDRCREHCSMCHVHGVSIAVWHGPTTELMSSRHTHVPPRAAEQRSRISVRITCVAASKRHCPADTTSPYCRGARRCNAATSSRGTRRLPPAPRAPRGVLPRSRRCRSSSSTWPNARNASSASGHSAVASRGDTRAKLSGAESSLKQP